MMMITGSTIAPILSQASLLEAAKLSTGNFMPYKMKSKEMER